MRIYCYFYRLYQTDFFESKTKTLGKRHPPDQGAIFLYENGIVLMKNFYYLVSSLPSLKWNEKAPMSAQNFVSSCLMWLSKEENKLLNDISLMPSKTGMKECPSVPSALLQWNDWECALRNGIVHFRAREKQRSPEKYIAYQKNVYSGLDSLVQNSFSSSSPLEKEKILDQARWKKLEELSSLHQFNFEFILIYKLKLLILEKWNLLDKTIGESKFMEIQKRLLNQEAMKHA
jgi:hypothetical protein